MIRMPDNGLQLLTFDGKASTRESKKDYLPKAGSPLTSVDYLFSASFDELV